MPGASLAERPSGPILRNLLFFFCIAMGNGGFQTFTVVGLGAIWGTPASVATSGRVSPKAWMSIA